MIIIVINRQRSKSIHRIQALTDKESERYYINQLNTAPSVEIVEELLNCIKRKPSQFSSNFCQQYGLFSLNTFLLKNLMSVFQKKTTRLSLERNKQQQENIRLIEHQESVYDVIYKCIECMKELSERVSSNLFKDNLDVVKSISLVLGSSFFTRENRVHIPILKCQLLVLNIFTSHLQRGECYYYHQMTITDQFFDPNLKKSN